MNKELRRGVIGNSSLLEVLVLRLGAPKVLELWQGSVAVPPKLLPIGK